MSETLTHYNFAAPTLQQVRQTIGLTLEESIHRLTEGCCKEPLTSEMVKHYRALHTTKAAPLTRLFDGAISTLTELRRRNIFTILVSNKGRAGLHQLLAQLKITNYINIVISAEDTTHRKPDARLYTDHIVPLLPFTPDSQTLVVGDTETDILFAKNANLLSCWATYGYGDAQRCKALSPDFKLHSLADLPRSFS
jgi:phosphoglycolate phosphatase-like HAD superfamily hydrolase